MGMPKVLVVDDEPSMVKVLSGFLAQEKIPCATASSGEAALKVLHAEDIGVIVTDLKMTGMDGLQLLEHALNIDRSLQVILMTAHGTSEVGQRAWEMGAAGYVRKPFDRDEILFEVRRALDRIQAGGEVAESPGEMVGQSQPMKDVYGMVARVASTSSTVLIRGESGTGKELVARAVHDQSKRKGKPFIKVICAALPETLIESELFGYEKGAFTGAAASSSPRAARSSSTRSANSRPRRRSSYSGSCRTGSSSGSAASPRCAPTSASSPRRTATSRPW